MNREVVTRTAHYTLAVRGGATSADSNAALGGRRGNYRTVTAMSTIRTRKITSSVTSTTSPFDLVRAMGTSSIRMPALPLQAQPAIMTSV